MDFNFLTTHVGSVPHPSPERIAPWLAAHLDIPAWPQLSQRNFRESMYIMYAPVLPGIIIDEHAEKVYFDTTAELSNALEFFYDAYLADNVNYFGLYNDYAQGFGVMLKALQSRPGQWAKGQVTGPISFGLTVTDQSLRASLYNELLADAIVKNMAMNARWQIRQLKTVRPHVILFVDEPYMASFGSAFISLSREQVIAWLDEIFDAIHAEGALAGVHCCANTDWSVLLASKVDILNLDAYGYVENLALYPKELRAYLDRGGAVCWGVVPNNERIHEETPQSIANRLHKGIKLIAEKAIARHIPIKPDEFASCSLVSPACGLGPTTIEIADEVFEKLARTGEILRKG